LNKLDQSWPQLASRVKRLGHLDLAGAGQVSVVGDYAYIGHIPNREQLSTTILDISDPYKPRVIATLKLDDPDSHSHKARVAGDLMIVNHERNMTAIGRRAEQLPGVRQALRERLKREPVMAEIAEQMSLSEVDVRTAEDVEKRGYDKGGFRIYDVSNPAQPKLLCHHVTGGRGVHRFDMDENYAYISTEMDGYTGNILVIYDLRDPVRPREVSRWWMPGQHAKGGEVATWPGRQHRLHHALRFGDELWAGVWHGGLRIIDIADITQPRTVASYNYHPPFPEPTHTVMPVPQKVGSRRIAVAIDEEDQFYNATDAAKRRGRPHACLWTFDVSDYANLKPLACFSVSELDSPWSRTPKSRFGAHQFAEFMTDTLIYATWFSGGLRIVDVADPSAPQEVGFFIPEPVQGQPAPQSNDVTLDSRGLIYLVDRNAGFDILEFER
jgi:hypothetical protein